MLAQKYLGLSAADVTDANPKLRTGLLGAVHRALNPGCKFDTWLVFLGDQEGGKSTFFKSLASPAWFCDKQLGAINKDLYLRMHSCWIYEIASLKPSPLSEWPCRPGRENESPLSLTSLSPIVLRKSSGRVGQGRNSLDRRSAWPKLIRCP